LILLDTNILLRLVATTDPLFATVNTAIGGLQVSGEVLCIVPQNLYEFWATATRPLAANGLGLSVPECQLEVERFKQLFRFLEDLPGLFSEWETLVVAHLCHGRVSFDARLVAAMRTHGLIRLLTLNASDFARFPGLVLIDSTAPIAPGAPPAIHP
jgi:predicted nucleic acid-binding protein